MQAFSTPQKNISKLAANEILSNIPGHRAHSSRSMFYPPENDYRTDAYNNNVSNYGSPDEARKMKAIQKKDDVFSIAMLNPPIAFFDNQD